jgi:hypothetical protein
VSLQHNTGKAIIITTELTVLDNRILSKNIWRGQGTGDGRKWPNEELYYLYSLPNIRVRKSEGDDMGVP